MRTDGQTGMKVITVTFRNFVKAPDVYTKHINTFCRQYIEFVDVKPCGAKINGWVSVVKPTRSTIVSSLFYFGMTV